MTLITPPSTDPHTEEADPLTISTRSIIWAGIEETSGKLLDRLSSETPSTKTWEKNTLALSMYVWAVIPGPPLC